MPPITAAREAIKQADEFIVEYFAFRRPVSAEQFESTWLVVFNTGILLSQELVYVTIDSNTSNVIGYRSKE